VIRHHAVSAIHDERFLNAVPGLAFRIIMDVLVMRTLLVPALVVLFGRGNWWQPAVRRSSDAPS
jgi:uncharacterized membrane protein YdfJ with MMPL/SSD domain